MTARQDNKRASMDGLGDGLADSINLLTDTLKKAGLSDEDIGKVLAGEIPDGYSAEDLQNLLAGAAVNKENNEKDKPPVYDDMEPGVIVVDPDALKGAGLSDGDILKILNNELPDGYSEEDLKILLAGAAIKTKNEKDGIVYDNLVPGGIIVDNIEGPSPPKVSNESNEKDEPIYDNMAPGGIVVDNTEPYKPPKTGGVNEDIKALDKGEAENTVDNMGNPDGSIPTIDSSILGNLGDTLGDLLNTATNGKEIDNVFSLEGIVDGVFDDDMIRNKIEDLLPDEWKDEWQDEGVTEKVVATLSTQPTEAQTNFLTGASPPECIRSTAEPYNGKHRGVAGSEGWAIALSILFFLGTAFSIVFIRKTFCGKKSGKVNKMSCPPKFVLYSKIYITTLLASALLGMTTGLLVYYWPQDPQFAHCSKSLDLGGIVGNLIIGDVNIARNIHLTLYNPNHRDMNFKETLGAIEYKGEQFGTFLVPELTAESRTLMDGVMDVDFTLLEDESLLQMARDYSENDLTLTVRMDIDYKVKGFGGSEAKWVKTIESSDFEETESSDEKDKSSYSRFCKCHGS
uniref:Uncharacterized protein n=1 Tax=Ditylum brightwellii TaxID=49249 RepID=A0A7S2EBW4_9STRA